MVTGMTSDKWAAVLKLTDELTSRDLCDKCSPTCLGKGGCQGPRWQLQPHQEKNGSAFQEQSILLLFWKWSFIEYQWLIFLLISVHILTMREHKNLAQIHKYEQVSWILSLSTVSPQFYLCFLYLHYIGENQTLAIVQIHSYNLGDDISFLTLTSSSVWLQLRELAFLCGIRFWQYCHCPSTSCPHPHLSDMQKS